MAAFCRILDQRTRFKRNRQCEAQSAFRGIEDAAFKMGMGRDLENCNYRGIINRKPGFRPPFPSTQKTYPSILERAYSVVKRGHQPKASYSTSFI